MIAPPHYKCECITLDKVKGVEKLEQALEIIQKEIKARKGTFKLLNKPQIIGAKDDKDIDDIMAKIHDDEEASEEEDNEEGMGDLDLGEEGEEERKEESKVSKKQKRKGSDDDDDDDDEDEDDDS